ncbi:hypothetical protein BJV78DRAFT_1156943 [Lactifluus subvellereus]|nr:hypothetical protein BJV78DRAFT_1156943 [Lactifluus subvellereus]
MKSTSSPVFLGVVMASFLLSNHCNVRVRALLYVTIEVWILRDIGRRVNFEGSETMDVMRGIMLPVSFNYQRTSLYRHLHCEPNALFCDFVSVGVYRDSDPTTCSGSVTLYPKNRRASTKADLFPVRLLPIKIGGYIAVVLQIQERDREMGDRCHGLARGVLEVEVEVCHKCKSGFTYISGVFNDSGDLKSVCEVELPSMALLF